MAGRVFVSYSRLDAAYVERLISFIRAAGLDVWTDAQISNGERWDREVKHQIDSCAAFVLVMSCHSEASAWVSEEIDRARLRRKPILPLLLDGHAHFGFSRTKYTRVAGEVMPDAEFLNTLGILCHNGVVTPGRPGVAIAPGL